MTSSKDFTDEEWARIRRAPIVAGVAISLADPGGPIELAKETAATLRSATLPPSQEVLEELRAVNELLTAKATPEEAEAFRRWLLAAAQAAANAGKEGGFLGFGAERVSAGERRMLDQVRAVLGMA
jgi:hypothetical protein